MKMNTTMEPRITVKRAIKILEQVLRDKILIIEKLHHSYYGTPQELVDKFAAAMTKEKTNEH